MQPAFRQPRSRVVNRVRACRLICAALILAASAFAFAQGESSRNPLILLDAHQDALRRVLDRGDHLGETYGDEQGSIPQWKVGGWNAIWFSVWVDPRKYSGADAVVRADRLIAAYRKQMAKYPSTLVACDTASEIRQAVANGKIACMLGLEGGVAINNDPKLISYYREQGVTYMTLTWRGNLSWAGSSQSNNPKMGLTPLGVQVVTEMNRVGMLVDLSHVSDATFNDALDATEKPVIVSHSNARLLSPHARNVTDAMLKRLGANGGVIGVNFAGDFLRPGADGQLRRMAGSPTLETVLDQIDHIAQVAGVDHVGIGTDYDGGIRPARGLENASRGAALISGLTKRGYSESEIRKICGENFLRVLEQNSASPSQ